MRCDAAASGVGHPMTSSSSQNAGPPAARKKSAARMRRGPHRLALHVFAILLSSVTAVPTARAVLPIDPENDPFGRKDPFLALSSDELRTQWSLVEDTFEDEALVLPPDVEPLSPSRDGVYHLAERMGKITALRDTTALTPPR